MGYLIKPQTDQIVTAKVTLTQADLFTTGFILDIPEYPAVKDYYWQVLSMTGHITGGTLPYVGTSTIHIQASTALTLQFRFGGAYMQSAVDTWQYGTINTNPTNGICFVDNDKLQVHNPTGITLGDSDLIIYISAILIKS
jgi:hypothetical protein